MCWESTARVLEAFDGGTSLKDGHENLVSPCGKGVPRASASSLLPAPIAVMPGTREPRDSQSPAVRRNNRVHTGHGERFIVEKQGAA